MEKFNWKAHLKDSFKKTLKEFVQVVLFLVSFNFAMWFIISCQTESQWQTLMQIIVDKNWIIIFLLIIGIIVITYIIEQILTGIINFIFNIIK